jgi:hypothetical protein
MIAGRAISSRLARGKSMNLPRIELSALPDLDVATGIFGSLGHGIAGTEDGVVVIMVFLYDILNPAQLI